MVCINLCAIGLRNGADHFFFFVVTLIGLSSAGVCVVFCIGAVIGVFTVAQNLYSLVFTFSLVRFTVYVLVCVCVCVRTYVHMCMHGCTCVVFLCACMYVCVARLYLLLCCSSYVHYMLDHSFTGVHRLPDQSG